MYQQKKSPTYRILHRSVGKNQKALPESGEAQAAVEQISAHICAIQYIAAQITQDPNIFSWYSIFLYTGI
jgi:hypothetical protein